MSILFVKQSAREEVAFHAMRVREIWRLMFPRSTDTYDFDKTAMLRRPHF